MGQSSAATVREIEDIRERLDSSLRELERRVPQPAVWAKRVVGLAVGGGATAFVIGAVLKRRRKRAAKKKPAQRISGPAPVSAVVQMVPEQVAEKMATALEDGRWKQWAAAGVGVWLALRLIELRQLRRLNRALLETRA